MIFAPVYFLWQVIFDFSLFGVSEKAASVTRFLCGLPAAAWLAAFLALTAGTAFLLARNIMYDKNFITPGAIKLYLDKLPCGVCCYRDNGRVLFSNICMNDLCVSITKSRLLNGNHFREAVRGGVVEAMGKVWRFSCRDFFSGGEKLHEMIASDISAEYGKTKALERDKAELSQLNHELREYYLSIDDTVRRQEILQAKVNIHDEMNKLMLSTTAADSEDTEELNRIFGLWEENALLLCMEAEETSDTKAADSIKQLADTLKIRLVWRDALPSELSTKERGLFFSAAKEAIINAVKHAEAKTVNISFLDNGKWLCCNFTNDGKIPQGNVDFKGGLLNLSVLAGKQGAYVSVKTEKEFTQLML